MFIGQPTFLSFPWEHGLILQLQKVTHGSLGAAFAIFAARYVIMVLVAWVIWQERTAKNQELRHAMREAGWSGMFALLLALILGEVIRRTRPFVTLADVQLLIPMPLSQYSFPSAHSSLAFGMAFACLWGATKKHQAFIPMILAALVALGRVLVGVHYPTDVFAGLCVGALSFALVRTMHHVVRHLPARV